jgi:hypothetical protein
MAEKENPSAQAHTVDHSGSNSLDSSYTQDKNGYGSNEDHVFTDVKTTSYWSAIYEKANYEGLHRFDPNYKWTPKEELNLLRKVSFRVSRYSLTCLTDLKRSIGESCCGHG